MDGSGSEWVLRRPAASLAPVVARYVGYRLVGFPAGLHRGLPSPHLTFVVSIGPPIDVVAQSDRAQAPARYRAVVGGLHASPALIAHDGHQEGVTVELTPLGCRALLGVPASALWNTSLDLAELVGLAATELWERLQHAERWEERFAACDDVLVRLRREHRVEPALARSWLLFSSSRGTVPVADVADAVGWTRPHLTRRFTAEFGLAPKLAARIARFDRARRLLHAPGTSIADVAYRCGYYDQAHLTRDFAEFAGIPPGRLLAEDLPSVQDDETAGEATSVA